MFLETERLLLRKFRSEDFEDYYAYAADKELNRMMANNDLTRREDALACFNWLKDKQERGYVLVCKSNGKVIGNLNITPLPDFLVERDMEELRDRNGVSLSFALSRQYWRQGLMSEAVRAVIDHLFQVEGLDFIQCGYLDFNLPSRAFQEKLGFTFLTSETIDIDGEEIHTVENILWRGDWCGTRPQ